MRGLKVGRPAKDHGIRVGPDGNIIAWQCFLRRNFPTVKCIPVLGGGYQELKKQLEIPRNLSTSNDPETKMIEQQEPATLTGCGVLEPQRQQPRGWLAYVRVATGDQHLRRDRFPREKSRKIPTIQQRWGSISRIYPVKITVSWALLSECG